MQIKESTITGSEPITLADVKLYCKIDYDTEDTLITLLITGVREQIEKFTHLSLIAKTLIYFNEEINEEIILPYPEHSAITEVAINGTATTGYTKTGLSQFIIYPTATYSLGQNDQGIKITYTTTGNCPEGIKIEMLRLLAEKYRQRGNTFEGATTELTENSYANLSGFCKMR